MSYRRADLLARCLDSVGLHLPNSRVRVWDNDSEGTLQIRRLSQLYPDADWTFCPDNIGFAGAVNRLMRRCDSPSVLLLNPDAVLLGDLIATRQAVADTRVAAAAPWIEDPPRRPWDSAHREPTLLRSLVNYAGWEDRMGRRAALSMAYARQPVEVDGYLTGACLLIARSAWRAVGEFDERFFLYAEEVDWCRRARAAGYALLAVPELGIAHTAAGTVSDAPSASDLSARMLQSSRVRYMTKHSGPRVGRAFAAASTFLDAAQPSKRRYRRRADAT
ncbi:MAG: glycosyltransferase, partial [Dermatophilaceae bacterium]